MLENHNQQGQSRALISQSHDENDFIHSHETASDGNCFFHAVFGKKNTQNVYKAEKAEKMRQEWHEFLNKFQSLQDVNMPNALKSQLEKIFSLFLENPDDLTNRSQNIKKLAEETQKEINNVETKITKLKSEIVEKFLQDVSFRKEIVKIIFYDRNKKQPNSQEVNEGMKELLNNRDKLINDIEHDLENCVLKLNSRLDKTQYRKMYRKESVEAQLFLENPLVYKNYLDAIKDNKYYVFFEEIPILASLANIKINIHYNNGYGEQIQEFAPNANLLGDYPLKINIWGNNNGKEALIYHAGEHFFHDKSNKLLPQHQLSSINNQERQELAANQQSTSQKKRGSEGSNESQKPKKSKLSNESKSRSSTDTNSEEQFSAKRKATTDVEDGTSKNKIRKVTDIAQKQLLDNLEISSEGSKLAQHGNIFQLKLLMLFLWRAKENNYTAFRLATELSEAEKFDDVVFQYQQSEGKKRKEIQQKQNC